MPEPRIVVCQQPNYFPWLGYLEQCAVADTLIFLDSVQWIRQGRQHRTRILSQSAADGAAWLTLPIRGKGHREKEIRELSVADGSWARRHWNTLQATYARRPYFKSQLEPIVRPWMEKLASEPGFFEIASGSVRLCLETLGFRPEILKSSELPCEGKSTERLVSLCRTVGATDYYSGIGSTYIDASGFRDAGIHLVWQRWKHPEYEQGRAARKTHLSFLDALANVPVAELKRWLEIKPSGPFGAETREFLRSATAAPDSL
jgi:hypothetical protein